MARTDKVEADDFCDNSSYCTSNFAISNNDLIIDLFISRVFY